MDETLGLMKLSLARKLQPLASSNAARRAAAAAAALLFYQNLTIAHSAHPSFRPLNPTTIKTLFNKDDKRGNLDAIS